MEEEETIVEFQPEEIEELSLVVTSWHLELVRMDERYIAVDLVPAAVMAKKVVPSGLPASVLALTLVPSPHPRKPAVSPIHNRKHHQ